jgi:hypothetical protein
MSINNKPIFTPITCDTQEAPELVQGVLVLESVHIESYWLSEPDGSGTGRKTLYFIFSSSTCLFELGQLDQAVVYIHYIIGP